MSLLLVLLVSSALLFDGDFRARARFIAKEDLLRALLLGFSSAASLYAVFAVGNALSRTLFDFAGADISRVYDFRGDASPIRIGLLMVLVIGPGEELFWRVYLQDRLAFRLGPWRACILGVFFYTIVHVATGNLMLCLAAATCGLFWGALWARFRSPLANILSHTAWDIAVFLLFPF